MSVSVKTGFLYHMGDWQLPRQNSLGNCHFIRVWIYLRLYCKYEQVIRMINVCVCVVCMYSKMYLFIVNIAFFFVYCRTHQPATVSDSNVSTQKAPDISHLCVRSNYLLELREQRK